MSLINTFVNVARWPTDLRKPLRRFFLNTRILGPRVSPSTTAMTRAFATNGEPARNSPPSSVDEEHLVDAHLLTGREAAQSMDLDDDPGGHLDLPAAALDDCEHACHLRPDQLPSPNLTSKA